MVKCFGIIGKGENEEGALIMTKYEFGPWIEHDGSGMPVDGGTLVCVKFKDGDASFEECQLPASCWHFLYSESDSNWVASGTEDDDALIVSYRIATPIKEKPFYTSVDAVGRDQKDWEDIDT